MQWLSWLMPGNCLQDKMTWSFIYWNPPILLNRCLIYVNHYLVCITTEMHPYYLHFYHTIVKPDLRGGQNVVDQNEKSAQAKVAQLLHSITDRHSKTCMFIYDPCAICRELKNITGIGYAGLVMIGFNKPITCRFVLNETENIFTLLTFINNNGLCFLQIHLIMPICITLILLW